MSKHNSADNYRFNITNTAQKKTATLTLFGLIGGWRVNLNSLKYDLDNAGNVDEIVVLLNTFGGTFYDGLPIYNLLKTHPAHVTVRIMGFALSMGSHIMLAGDKVEIARNGIVMIHNAQGWEAGSPDDLRKYADTMETHEAALLPAYAERMGKSKEEVQALLNAETWYTAEEAKAAGLVDHIFDEEAKKPPVDDEEELENVINSFKNLPVNLTQLLSASTKPKHAGNWLSRLINKTIGEPPQRFQPNNNEVDMTQEELKAVITSSTAAGVKLGLQAAQEIANNNQATPNQEEKPADETTALKEKIAALEAENKSLKEPANNAKIPNNTGGDDSPEYDY